MAVREGEAVIDALESENHKLRRSLESTTVLETPDHELRELRKRNARIEAENETLTSRVRELLRSSKESQNARVLLLNHELLQSNERTAEFRRRYEDLDRRLKRLRQNMDGYIEQNAHLISENQVLRRDLEMEERRRRYGD